MPPMPPTPLQPPTAPNGVTAEGRRELTPDDAALVKQAGVRAKKIRRAAAVAGFSGWTAAVFGVTALLGGFWSAPALVLGIGLCAGAFLELRGRSLLTALDPRGPRLLTINQGVIAGVITVYCVWQMLASSSSVASMPDLNTPEVDEALRSSLGQSAQSLVTTVTFVLYGSVIVLTAIYQGLMALYYHSRGRLLAEHRAKTPAWIADIQRRLAA